MGEETNKKPGFLVHGHDYLATKPDFKLIGRKDDLNAIMDVLLRKNTGNNLVLHGQNGVGLSSLVLGLQTKQLEDDTPIALATKDFYYLDVDGLFSSGNPTAINNAFKTALDTLQTAQEPVLVIEDTKGFLDGLRNTGANNLMNMLMHAAKTEPRVQIVFESADATLPDLLSTHSDVAKLFTLQDVGAPNDKDLRDILDNTAKQFAQQYDVEISKSAVDQVMDLTKKYPGLTLDLAQPKRAIVILEGALVAYCRTARTRPAELDDLEEKLGHIDEALESGNPAGDLAGKTKKELAGLKLETENTIKEVGGDWLSRKNGLQKLREDQIDAQTQLKEIEVAVANLRENDQYLKDMRDAYHAAKTEEEKQKIKEEYKLKKGKDLVVGQSGGMRDKFKQFADLETAESEEITNLLAARKDIETALEENKKKRAEFLQDAGADNLVLDETHVLSEFSRLARVPMNKLQEDEGERLLNLPNLMKERVFGQDEPIEALANAILNSRNGLRDPQKPIGSFLFLGPSGVGKTELSKALADALDLSLQVYNMSEYMESHASATLIGSPPGYAGYEAGGLLTNNMRANPYCVNLFDEVEKADKNVFDLFLQVLDEGTLSDRLGRKASFTNSVNIFTSNVGAEYFLDENLSFEEAKRKARLDLESNAPDPNNPGKKIGFRIEFLNRFDGIFCFNRLGQVEIIKIADRNLQTLNEWLEGRNVTVNMPEKDLAAMCDDQYITKEGARGIKNYIKSKITSNVSKELLLNKGAHGTVEVTYTPTPDKDFPELAEIKTQFHAAAAKDKAPAKTPANDATPPAPRKTKGQNPG